jgi:bacillithiol synthase
MFGAQPVSPETSRAYNRLIIDYISRNEKLRDFYHHFPDKDGFAALLKENPYAGLDRGQLAEVLLSQCASTNASQLTLANIEKLKRENTFCITTGHQLCLFTGPLYFVYKILTAVKLAERLALEFPGKDFVPVYWMASEDHDFEEVNHFHAFGKTITWHAPEKGPVGRFNTNSLEVISEEVKSLFGSTAEGKVLYEIFRESYLPAKDLARATRHLVNALFGKYGVVTVDADDARLKGLCKNIFKKDILANSCYEDVKQAAGKLTELDYGVQVNPRQINVFYMEQGLRARLEKTGERYSVVGTDITFTTSELEAIIEKEPARISPNVVLRPVYQQVILPNLAYVGGPGELAYWFEYRQMFMNLGVFFPALVPRASFTILDKTTSGKISKLGLTAVELFSDPLKLEQLLQKNAGDVADLTMERAAIEALYKTILSTATEADPTLEGAVNAELQKTRTGITTLENKINKALKQRSETSIRQMHTAYARFFPVNLPQERYENFSTYYLRYGEGFFDAIKDQLDPLLFSHVLLTEK